MNRQAQTSRQRRGQLGAETRAGRVAQLRKEAAKRGLDPNVWFHNVEYVAAKKIGAETVTYVSNIYKYYIAYKLLLEIRAEKDLVTKQIGDKKL